MKEQVKKKATGRRDELLGVATASWGEYLINTAISELNEKKVEEGEFVIMSFERDGVIFKYAIENFEGNLLGLPVYAQDSDGQVYVFLQNEAIITAEEWSRIGNKEFIEALCQFMLDLAEKHAKETGVVPSPQPVYPS